MNLTNTIVNLRNLKDEALRLKEDMDYPTTLQIVAFCDRAVQEFSKVDDKYGPAFSVYTSAEETAAPVLTLQDIATADQQEKLMEKLARNVELYSMTFHPTSEAFATPEQFAEDKKRISAFLGKEDWPSHLFTNAEISVMVERLDKGPEGERDVLDKINGAISKDFMQKLKIQQMKKNKPIEKICESVMNLNALGKNNNAGFNKWILDEYKSIHQTFGSRDSSFPSVFLLDNVESRCAEAAQPKNAMVSMGISDDDRQAVSRFASYVSGTFDKAMEQRRNMQELTNGKYEAFTRPIVKFLKATGMDEEKILNVFDGMKRTAEKLLGKSNSMVR